MGFRSFSSIGPIGLSNIFIVHNETLLRCNINLRYCTAVSKHINRVNCNHNILYRILKICNSEKCSQCKTAISVLIFSIGTLLKAKSYRKDATIGP